MPINNLTHFVLIDFENVPGVDLSELGRHPMTVTLFLGPKSKLKAGLVEQITTMPFEVRLIKVGLIKKNALDFVLVYHLGEMAPRYPRGHYYIVSGDQGFDPLVTYLRNHGIYVSRHDRIAELPFLTSAKPLTPPKLEAAPEPALVVKPVFAAKPVTSSKGTAPFEIAAPLNAIGTHKPTSSVVKPVISADKPPNLRRTKIIARLKDPTNTNRSTTLKSLRAYIKNSLGNESTPTNVEGILDELLIDGVFSVVAKDKVVYH